MYVGTGTSPAHVRVCCLCLSQLLGLHGGFEFLVSCDGFALLPVCVCVCVRVHP